MPAMHVRAFEKAAQKSYDWVKDVMHELGIQDPEIAYAALHSTLRALRDRLTVEEAAQLAAQLPMLLRGTYFEGWNPTGKPVKERHREAFLAHIKEIHRDQQVVSPEKAARAVFSVLARRVSSGEIHDIVGILPRELRDLWPTAASV